MIAVKGVGSVIAVNSVVLRLRETSVDMNEDSGIEDRVGSWLLLATKVVNEGNLDAMWHISSPF